MRLNRCFALPPIFSRYSRVRSGRSGSLSAMLSRPIIAFIGVRISWLMELRNEVLAAFASFACASASLRARRFAMESRVSASTSEKPIPTARMTESARSSAMRTSAIRSISYCSCPSITVR